MFLDALDAEDAQALRSLGQSRSYARGQVLFHAGDEAGSALILLDGRLRISLIGPEAKEIVLGLARAGDLVGELSAISDGPRTATVTALDDVTVLAVPRSAFQAFLTEHPPALWALLRLVAGRLHVADTQRTEFASYDVLHRVARRLAQLAEESGDAEVELTQDELAAWTSASREAVSRALTQLRALGWIETRRRHIVVRDAAALRDLTP